MHPTELPAHALATAIRAGDLSCRETMTAFLDRIDALNPAFNAIVDLRDRPTLLAEADAHDARRARAAPDEPLGALFGLPIAVKDLSDVAGMRTSMGSPLRADHVAAADSLMVSRMRAAGALLIGRTNVPEFGLGSHTFNTLHGTTRNAYAPDRSAGGSSGGAAVALALRLLPVADGSDFMGSLRNPAGWNNGFGLRPSIGRVPGWPAVDVCVMPMGTEGPMGRHVRDVARLLDVQSGPDPRVPLAQTTIEVVEPTLAAADVRGMRIGWLGDLAGHLAMEDGILPICEQALARLAALGCRVAPMAPPFPPAEAWETWLVWRRWLTAARIAPLLRQPGARERVKPEALWECDGASRLTGPEMLAASQARSTFYQRLRTAFEQVDVLALPSAQVWPFPADERWPRVIAGRTMDTYHRWMEVTIHATLAGLPCVCVPAGFGPGGLPMGLQLIGAPRADGALLRLAHAYEQAIPDLLAVRPPAITDPGIEAH